MEYKKIFFSKLIFFLVLSHPVTSLSKEVLAFPEGNFDDKITPYPVQVYSEKKLKAYGAAQGFCVSNDSPEGGVQFRYAAQLLPGRYAIFLQAPTNLRGERKRTGYELVVDFAVFSYCGQDSEKMGYLPSFRAEIYVQGILAHTIEMGYGNVVKSPVFLPIPFIRDTEGKIKIEIFVPNRRGNEIFLYDIFLQ